MEDEIREIIHRVNDDTYIHTPRKLCDRMVEDVDVLSDVLVVRNLEFVYALFENKHDMSKVHYVSDNELFGYVAISLGVAKHIQSLSVYNDMKFDYVIMNPPYNPNALWKKFVEKGIDLLKDTGKLIAIHPADWRESSKHTNLYNYLVQGIEELHICDYENFKDNKVATKTDWYVYNKKGSDSTTVYYNNDTEILDLKQIDKILRFSTKSIQYSILKKLTIPNYDNGCIMQGRTGYHPLYKKHVDTGTYKQCGTEGRGVKWTTGDFSLTDEANDNQYQDKVVIAYANKPRAKFFKSSDAVGAVRANFWLTDNESLPILLNSKMFWKLCCKIVDPDKGMYKPYGLMAGIPSWILKSLNFEGLTVQNEDELYKHYKLTEEEINWIEQQ